MQFADRIAAIRKSMKISQGKFGELVNVSQRTVAFWESGERLPSHSTFAVLADKLNVSVDYLLGRENAGRQQLSAEEASLLQLYARLDRQNRIRVTERAQTLFELQTAE